MSPSVSMRRTAAVAAVMFVLILAFLAGRVHAGADPTQATAPSSRTADSVPTPDAAAPDVAPDQGTVPSPGGQDLDPPTTQAS